MVVTSKNDELMDRLIRLSPYSTIPNEIECEDLYNLVIEQREHAVSEALSAIHNIANDLAWKDTNNTGSESIVPYFGNAVTIYQEWLKGSNYERIDVTKLDLPTITMLESKKNESK